jgi:hypothetical protein
MIDGRPFKGNAALGLLFACPRPDRALQPVGDDDRGPAPNQKETR